MRDITYVVTAFKMNQYLESDLLYNQTHVDKWKEFFIMCKLPLESQLFIDSEQMIKWERIWIQIIND